MNTSYKLKRNDRCNTTLCDMVVHNCSGNAIWAYYGRKHKEWKLSRDFGYVIDLNTYSQCAKCKDTFPVLKKLRVALALRELKR